MTLYTSRVIADWLGISERRVRQLRDEGVIAEAGPGLYDLKSTISKYITYLGGASRETLNAERTKLTAEKRKAAEMENDLRRGTLKQTEDIKTALKTVFLNVRSRMLAIPAKLSPALADKGGDRDAIYDALKSAIREALEDLSDCRISVSVEGGVPDEDGDY